MKIGILGGGSWGTTLAIMLSQSPLEVCLWEYFAENVENMQRDRQNKAFLPGFHFPPRLKVTNDIEETVDKSDVILSVVPSHAVRNTMHLIKDLIRPDAILVSASKGIEQDSMMRMSEVILDVLTPICAPERIAVLTGPSHAEEVVRGIPTSVVVASQSIECANFIQQIMSNERFRLYSNDDVVGAEIAGALKNVIAIAAGISAGLGFGDNTLGALLTRGLSEIKRCGNALGCRAATFAGLAGMGDLITTCCSRHSRNRFVGEELGKGRKLKDILGNMLMIAEGVRTTDAAYQLSQKFDIEMPITEQVHRILFKDADPMKATTDLMTRRLKVED